MIRDRNRERDDHEESLIEKKIIRMYSRIETSRVHASNRLDSDIQLTIFASCGNNQINKNDKTERERGRWKSVSCGITIGYP